MSQLNFFGEGLPYIMPADYPGMLITIEGTDGVGRTTQVTALRDWLEVQGYGVVETGWTRSPLIGGTISKAKQGRRLNRLTYSLLYAADFADRLEKEILLLAIHGMLHLLGFDHEGERDAALMRKKEQELLRQYADFRSEE